MDMNFLTPSQMVTACVNSGKKKANLPPIKAFILAIMAGAWISLAGAAATTAVSLFPYNSLVRLVTGLIFPFGLAMVIVLGSELVTGNCIMAAAFLEKEISLKKLLKSWGIVYMGNWVGASLCAFGGAFFGQLKINGGLLANDAIKLAAAKCSLPFFDALVMGIFCNVLVVAGVLMALAATDIGGKIIAAFVPVAIFVICGFEHAVANMYYIEAGLFARMNPLFSGLEVIGTADALTWGSFLFKNLLPVTIGNLIGGVLMVTAFWYCHREKPKP
ncbi:MAG: formate/nitrite transporter family protein [Oscillospiraceae bacterium]